MERTEMSETVTALINPIRGRHIPYRLENGDLVIQNDIMIIIDQHDGSFCACQATTENLILLKVIPVCTSELSNSSMTTTSNLESQILDSAESQIMDSQSQIIDSESQVMDSSKTTKYKGIKWSRDATLFLIDQWQKKSSEFASTTIRNEEVWKNIAKELQNAGFTGYTWKQVEDKWKNIRKSYMKVKDNKGEKSSGASRITCKFYDELDEIFKKSPSVKPISLVSSRNIKNLPITDNNDSDSEDLSKHEPKKKKSKLQKDTLTWLEILRDDANKREAARDNRHKQTLNVLNNAVTVYESLMQKFIDKM